jgi:CTP:molybdopterin cytidylyltransferase MocA
LTAGLVLAAGAGERFGGGVKQLAEFRGRPLLEHALIAMEAAPVDRVVVVLGAHAEEIRARVALHGAEAVVADDWADGMSASLRAGVAALHACDAVVVTLGDQPLIAPGAIARVAAASGPAARATYGGVPGHPALFRREVFDALRSIRGDQGAREIAAELVPCDGLGSPVDIDTPEALAVLGSPNS